MNTSKMKTNFLLLSVAISTMFHWNDKGRIKEIHAKVPAKRYGWERSSTTSAVPLFGAWYGLVFAER